MADPVPIVRTFMSSPEVTAEMRLDAVITMTDCKNLLGRLDDTIEEGKVNEAYQQVAFADKIILNKLDLVSTEDAIKVKDRIREINKYAKVVPSVKGRVKMTELCNIRAHDICHFVNDDIEKEAEEAPELTKGHGGHGEHGGHGGHGEHGGHGGHGGHEAKITAMGATAAMVVTVDIRNMEMTMALAMVEDMATEDTVPTDMMRGSTLSLSWHFGTGDSNGSVRKVGFIGCVVEAKAGPQCQRHKLIMWRLASEHRCPSSTGLHLGRLPISCRWVVLEPRFPADSKGLEWLVGRYVRIDDRLRTLGLCVKAMEVSCPNVVIRPFGHSDSIEQLWCQFREIVVRPGRAGEARAASFSFFGNDHL
eukprot:symbB.v1.2.021044.t1/scaffold1797.1/size100932/11